MKNNDLRDWLAAVERIGKLRHIKGADYNLEIGYITAVNISKDRTVLLFDDIQFACDCYWRWGCIDFDWRRC